MSEIVGYEADDEGRIHHRYENGDLVRTEYVVPRLAGSSITKAELDEFMRTCKPSARDLEAGRAVAERLGLLNEDAES